MPFEVEIIKEVKHFEVVGREFTVGSGDAELPVVFRDEEVVEQPAVETSDVSVAEDKVGGIPLNDYFFVGVEVFFTRDDMGFSGQNATEKWGEGVGHLDRREARRN